MFPLDGKRALITGAGSGIGEAIVRLFATQSTQVIVADMQTDAANRVTSNSTEQDDAARTLTLDLADETQVRVALTTWRIGMDTSISWSTTPGSGARATSWRQASITGPHMWAAFVAEQSPFRARDTCLFCVIASHPTMAIRPKAVPICDPYGGSSTFSLMANFHRGTLHMRRMTGLYVISRRRRRNVPRERPLTLDMAWAQAMSSVSEKVEDPYVLSSLTPVA
jgi:short chain dehydrogenase